MNDQAFTLWNIGLPLLVLGGGALIFPLLFVPKTTRSHRRVSFGIAVSAGVLVLLGVIVYFILDDRDLAAGFALNGVFGMTGMVMLGSLKTSLFWAPLLALSWLYAAQRVEKLRGDDMARGTTR